MCVLATLKHDFCAAIVSGLRQAPAAYCCLKLKRNEIYVPHSCCRVAVSLVCVCVWQHLPLYASLYSLLCCPVACLAFTLSCRFKDYTNVGHKSIFYVTKAITFGLALFLFPMLAPSCAPQRRLMEFLADSHILI